MPGPRPVALVTGASAGLGAAFARRAAAANCDLVLLARRLDRLDALAAELRAGGAAVETRRTDLADRDALDALCDQIASGALRVDILVNNAGIGLAGPLLTTGAAGLSALIDVDIVAPTLLLRAAIRAMAERGSGRILNVASLAAFQPGPNAAAYCAAKSYVKSLSDAAAFELRGTGVTVTALCPGPVDTGFADASGHDATRLFSGLIPVAGADAVAAAGWDAMMRGRRQAVPGAVPALLAALAPFTPAAITLRISAYLLGASPNPPAKEPLQ
jgi:short-subunit dehydrogenase